MIHIYKHSFRCDEALDLPDRPILVHSAWFDSPSANEATSFLRKISLCNQQGEKNAYTLRSITSTYMEENFWPQWINSCLQVSDGNLQNPITFLLSIAASCILHLCPQTTRDNTCGKVGQLLPHNHNGGQCVWIEKYSLCFHIKHTAQRYRNHSRLMLMAFALLSSSVSVK